MTHNNPSAEGTDLGESAAAPAEASAVARYVAAGGSLCPHCGSRDVVGGCIEVDGATAFQAIQCQACESDWVDLYTLKGFTDLVVNESGDRIQTESVSASEP